MVAGFGHAGLNLTTGNYIYDSVSQAKRSFGVTYFTLFVGIGAAIGAGLGSALTLIDLPIFNMNSIFLIFLVSGIIRLLVLFFFGRYLQEVRKVKRFSANYIVKEIVPMRGMTREIHRLNHYKSKVEHYLE